MTIKSVLSFVLKVDWLKSLRFNLHYFNLKVALHLPVLIYWRTQFNQLGGKVILQCSPCFGMIRIGEPRIGIQDYKFNRTIIQWGGEICLQTANIGRGCRICIGDGATLTLGDRFSVTGNTSIICCKSITFGEDCLLSWDILMMDTDFHRIYNEENIVINEDRPITFGDHVWVGCRSTVLKGTEIPSGSVIAAGSLLAGKRFVQANTIYGRRGDKVGVLAENVLWKH